MWNRVLALYADPGVVTDKTEKLWIPEDHLARSNPSQVDEETRNNRLAHVNEAIKLNREVHLLFVLVGIYLAILFGSTTHKQLLLESDVTLPLLNVGLPIVQMYAWIPWGWLLLHFNTLLLMYMLATQLGKLRQGGADGDQAWMEYVRQRIYVFPFPHWVLGLHRPLVTQLLRLYVLFTSLVLPLGLLVFAQVRFLPYQSELITWFQRGAVVVDLLLLWLLWPMILQAAGMRLDMVPKTFRVAQWASVGVLFVTFFLAVIPGERIEVAFLGEQLADPLFDRALKLPNEILVKEPPSQEILAQYLSFAMGKGADEIKRAEEEAWIRHSKGLELAERHFRRADFARTKMYNVKFYIQGKYPADLQGAVLREASLQGANLMQASLQGANLRFASLQGANLMQARLQGVDLNRASLQGANLRFASLQGVDLSGARLQGAYLMDAFLHGASLSESRLQGADLQGALMLGADLRGSSLYGAEFHGAILAGADLSWTSLLGANLFLTSLSMSELRGINLKAMDERSRQSWSDGVAAIEDPERKRQVQQRFEEVDKKLKAILSDNMEKVIFTNAIEAAEALVDGTIREYICQGRGEKDCPPLFDGDYEKRLDRTFFCSDPYVTLGMVRSASDWEKPNVTKAKVLDAWLPCPEVDLDAAEMPSKLQTEYHGMKKRLQKVIQ